MKAINKEIVTKKTVTIYEAADGTQFNSAEECKRYEKTYQCAIDSAYKKLVKKSFPADYVLDAIGYPSSEDTFEIVHVENVDDIYAVNMKIKSMRGDGEQRIVPTSSVGKDIAILIPGYDDTVYYCGTLEEIFERWFSELRRLFTVKEEEN